MEDHSRDELGCHGGLAFGHEEEQKRYFAENKIYTLQIESTQACRQGCIYCYAGSTPDESQGLTSDEIRRLLRDAAALEVRAIDWLGGDPLLRDDWYDLMAYARSLGLINNVWTSGLPLADPLIARRVDQVTAEGFVSVHVDSIHPDTYVRLHRAGTSSYIGQIISGVDNLLALDKPPDKMLNCITYTAWQTPEDAVSTMTWWRQEKGVRTCLTMFNPAGRGVEWRQLEPGREETRRVYRERDRLNYGDARQTIGAMDTDKYYCGTLATVTFDGEVTPCSVIRGGVDNIRHTPLPQIVAGHRDRLVHARLHDPANLPVPCNSCAENDHCWGCRSSAYNYSGDAEGVDPKCWRLGDRC